MGGHTIMGFLKKIAKKRKTETRKMIRKNGKRERKMLEREFYAEQKAEFDAIEEERQMLTDLQIIFFTALSELYGFGETRIQRLAQNVMKIAGDMRDMGEWAYEDMRSQLDIETKYNLDTRHVRGDREFQRRKKAVDRISLIYLWILHEEFGFSKKRLTDTYHRCAMLATENDKGTRTVDDMREELRKRGFLFITRKAA